MIKFEVGQVYKSIANSTILIVSRDGDLLTSQLECRGRVKQETVEISVEDGVEVVTHYGFIKFFSCEKDQLPPDVKESGSIIAEFKPGQVYFSTGTGDSQIGYECLKRTEKTVTVKNTITGEIVIRRVDVDRSKKYEIIYPKGKATSGIALQAKNTTPRSVRPYHIPMQTPFNQDKFFNGVYLDPSIEF